MTIGQVEVYLWLSETVTAEQRGEFLRGLADSLSPDMAMVEREDQAVVQFDQADPEAAAGAVQERAMPIRDRLGLGEQQVTWSLEPTSS
jgi:hypothetical protein